MLVYESSKFYTTNKLIFLGKMRVFDYHYPALKTLTIVGPGLVWVMLEWTKIIHKANLKNIFCFPLPDPVSPV